MAIALRLASRRLGLAILRSRIIGELVIAYKK